MNTAQKEESEDDERSWQREAKYTPLPLRPLPPQKATYTSQKFGKFDNTAHCGH